MKKSPFALVGLLGLVFVAASTNHQAFGPIHFGMTHNSTSLADVHLITEMRKEEGKLHFTAAHARKNFVIPGKRYPSKLESRDSSIDVLMEAKCEPLLSELTISSDKVPARDVDKVKDAWEVFQDIGDCKLPRVGQRGAFPAIDQIEPGREVVTDKWEGEGIRIELLVKSLPDKVLPDPLYVAVLRAIEITPGK